MEGMGEILNHFICEHGEPGLQHQVPGDPDVGGCSHLHDSLRHHRSPDHQDRREAGRIPHAIIRTRMYFHSALYVNIFLPKTSYTF